jgi:3-methyladenine DNA glycosylase AlkD
VKTAGEVLEVLKEKARPNQIEGMQRFGMATEGRMGLAIPEIRAIAKSLGRDHHLALGLWETGIAEARILASMVDSPKEVNAAQMDAWVKDFNSWDVCDQVCMNLFEKTSLAWEKVVEWSERDEEYVKRAAYALLACLAWHDKRASDEQFIRLFPVIRNGTTDERNFVKKAVNWALRNIGKRNRSLNRAAIELAREIQQIESRTARWIAADAIRELESEAVKKRLKR